MVPLNIYHVFRVTNTKQIITSIMVRPYVTPNSLFAVLIDFEALEVFEMIVSL